MQFALCMEIPAAVQAQWNILGAEFAVKVGSFCLRTCQTKWKRHWLSLAARTVAAAVPRFVLLKITKKTFRLEGWKRWQNSTFLHETVIYSMGLVFLLLAAVAHPDSAALYKTPPPACGGDGRQTLADQKRCNAFVIDGPTRRTIWFAEDTVFTIILLPWRTVRPGG